MEAVIVLLLLCSSFPTLRGNDLTDAGGVARVPRISSLSEGRGTVSVQSNSKPTFKNCSKYQPSVLEETEPGRHVLTVQAEDRDPPDAGGTLTYSFVTALGEREKFRIDNVTGEITTKQPFDRDEPSREKEVYIAVRATDNGRPQLDDICSIKVVIEDINDNRPIFDKVSYHESVPKDLKVGREVMRISATDIDDGKNSIVSYILMSERDASDMNYFRIDENTGVIFLNKSIDKPVDYKFKMKARAMDHGKPSLEQDIGVEITVVGSNRKAPTFLKTPDTLYIKENHTDFSTPLITIQASSNIPNDTPVFELLIGRTEQTNKQNTFVLEQHNDTAYIKLGKRLDYEAINEYQLIVRVQNKDNLAAQQFIVIKVEDVNDVIPVFIDIVPGSVLENEPPGTPVMQVRAIDLDGTTAHNQVTYELENVTEVQERFQIDPHTGNITTKVKFDREEKDFYKVKVIATDSSPSALFHDGRHNKGEHTFRIEIADINDNQPRFTKKMYIFEEIPEDANLNQQVGEVRAEDKDSASPVTYSIIDGNIGDAFLIENTTGKIRVKNALDYEIRTEYMLTVRAFDGAYKDEANVSIKIGNVNDNPPIFLPYNKNITIKEEELPEEECITKLEAYDPDIVNRSWPQHIVYFVVKEDQKDKLKINKDGCLSLIKSLDRDPPNGYDEWQVFIAADDEDGDVKSLRQTTDFLIHLIDINDNAPFLDMIQPVIWMENQPPGNITVLTAKDYDSDENGPPFKFVIDENASEDIKRKFYILDATLFANVTFDREEKKVYHIPIAITDSGVPPLTNTSFLMVVIGDVNDNAMKSGESSIFVYNYKGKAPDTVIGRVYVDDPDDWDIVDKHFRWKSDNVNQPFWLDTETGMITMLSGTSNSSFRLEFIVTEKSALIKEHFVEAAVNVTVKELPEEAVDKSGSIRFAGVSAEDFIAPGPDLKSSKLAQFSAYLANILNTSEENIDTFTVLHSPHNNDSNLLDVRFSVHGSPYYHPEKLNAIVGEHQEKLEIELGVKVVMINIDECLIEKAFCSELSCTNILNKSEVPYPVYTNTSSFVGVKAFVDPVCECQINPPKTKCLNGGTPLEDRCECNPGFEGPNCEILSVGFHGDGWALYPPIPACKEASLSLDITPMKDDGLILYVGPIRRNTVLNVQDFMSLELKDGYPRLLMDYGSGTTFLEHKQSRLSDGKLHHIDIFWTNTSIEMKVDSCQMSSCLRLTTPIKPNEFLNVNGPLQLGGSFIDLATLSKEMLWNYTPSDEKFSGCIRNLTFNGKTYNLGMPSHFKNIDPGCNKGLAKAVSFGIDTNFLVAILVCIAILLILLLAVVVHRRKTDDMYKDTDDIRENIINYEDEGGGEGDMTGYDLNVLRLMYDNQEKPPVKENIQTKGPDEVPDICGFLDDKKKVCDNDPETNPFDDVRHYAYEGDGNTTGSLSSLASGTDEGDLNFDYLSNFGPRFRKLADMYGEEPSDEEETFQNPASESWC